MVIIILLWNIFSQLLCYGRRIPLHELDARIDVSVGDAMNNEKEVTIGCVFCYSFAREMID
jgi:hypothetical protein